MIPPGPTDHLLAAFLGLLLPLLGAWQHWRKHSGPPADEAYDTREKITFYWGQSLTWWILGGLVLSSWRLGGRSLADLGLTTAPLNLVWGIALALLFLLVYAFDARRQVSTPERLAATRARWRRDTPFMPVTPREIRHSMVLVLTASVAEEVAYRGFLIRYVAYLTGESVPGLVVAVLLPALIFGLSHLYQGWTAVLKIVLLAAGFGAILVITQSLWIVMILHFIVDCVGMLLGPKLLGRAKAGEADGVVAVSPG